MSSFAIDPCIANPQHIINQPIPANSVGGSVDVTLSEHIDKFPIMYLGSLEYIVYRYEKTDDTFNIVGIVTWDADLMEWCLLSWEGEENDDLMTLFERHVAFQGLINIATKYSHWFRLAKYFQKDARGKKHNSETISEASFNQEGLLNVNIGFVPRGF